MNAMSAGDGERRLHASPPAASRALTGRNGVFAYGRQPRVSRACGVRGSCSWRTAPRRTRRSEGRPGAPGPQERSRLLRVRVGRRALRTWSARTTQTRARASQSSEASVPRWRRGSLSERDAPLRRPDDVVVQERLSRQVLREVQPRREDGRRLPPARPQRSLRTEDVLVDLEREPGRLVPAEALGLGSAAGGHLVGEVHVGDE